MSRRWAFFNGAWVPEAEARISIYDSSLVLGDMAYEVTRTFAQRPFRLREHLQRLFHSLAVLEIDPGMSLEALELATLETLERNLSSESNEVDWNVIHNISRGPSRAFLDAFPLAERRPTVVISCYPLTSRLAALAPAFTTGIDLVVPAQRAIPGEYLDATIKTRSRWYFQLAQQQADRTRSGAWAVLVDPRGFLTESTNANLFLVRRGRLSTPPAARVLSGVTRGLLLDLARELGIEAAESDLTLADAQAADELFVSSTSIGLLHARSFEGAPVGGGVLGPVARQLREAFDRLVGLSIAQQAEQYAGMSSRSGNSA